MIKLGERIAINPAKVESIVISPSVDTSNQPDGKFNMLINMDTGKTFEFKYGFESHAQEEKSRIEKLIDDINRRIKL